MNSTCEPGRHSARALKPYPDYADSGVAWLGEVPEHWNVRRMKTLLRERSTKGFPDKPLLAATQTKVTIYLTNHGGASTLSGHAVPQRDQPDHVDGRQPARAARPQR